MNEKNVRRLVAGLLLALPMSSSYAQGSDLDNLLGAPASSSSASRSPAAPASATNVKTPDKGSAPEKAVATTAAVSKDETAARTAKVGQSASPAAAPASRMIEEIVVTAEKREENIQDVPQAVTAFSAGKLEALGITTIEDLPNITPGLTISAAAGFNQVFLRGVGTDAFLPGADSSVPFYVDGIPLLGGQGNSNALGRITRVEVLKGPQGTLFGTNSVGGAINIITPDPGQDFNGDVELGYGNYNAKTASAYVSGPITDKLAASLSVYGNKQKNFYTNDSGPVIGIYSWGGRLKVRWDITDDLSNTFAGSYGQTSTNGGLTFENTRPAPLLAGVVYKDPKADRHVNYVNFFTGARNNSHLLSDIIDWKLPAVEIKAIGSAQRLHAGNVQATFGATSLPALLAQQHSGSNQYTGELQFSSTPDTPFSDRLTWVGGFFYLYSAGGLSPFTVPLEQNILPAIVGSPLGSALNQLLNPVTGLAGINLNDGILLNTYGTIVTQSLATYFQGTLKLTDTLNLILGGRFQHTRKVLEGERTTLPDPNAPGGEIPLPTSTDPTGIHVPTLYANQFSPRVGLQWRPFGPDSQIYASWARGYKSPTYNTVNLLGTLAGPINPVTQQKNNAYELGFKSELFDHTLQLNGSVFYTKEKDLLTGIVAVTSGGVVKYSNTPGARIYGAEGDVLWTPLPENDPGLVLTSSVSYLNTRYTDYPNGAGFDTATGLAFGPGFLLPLLPQRDLTGNKIVRSPPLTYTAGISQTVPLRGGSLEMAVDGNYNSGFYFLPQNSELYASKLYYLLNAHISYSYAPLGLRLTLWGKNLTQTTYDQTQFVDDFGRSEVLNDPRTYGATIKWSF